MSLSAKKVLFGSALLLAGVPLFAAETSGSSGVAGSPRAYVNCPGISSVPMTDDAEQALPLHQIATLTCGEAVAVLADDEGYTTHIRTEEGQEGYVARMYLTKVASPAQPKPDAPVQPVQPSTATAQNGTVRWYSGAPGCDQFMSHDRLVESITANGVTVQVSLQDTGWKLRATVAVSNESGKNVYVMPALITLDELKPSIHNLRQENPNKLSHNEANHQLMRAEYNAQPSPSAVAYRSNAAPATLFDSADHTSVAPEYFDLEASTTPVKALALKNANLATGQKTAGVLWFVRDANAHELSMRLSIGDVVYDFPFSLNEKK
jgi:hypothetical protein